jgi:hypothetical protein
LPAHGWRGFRRTWLLAALALSAIPLTSLLLLRTASLWWPPGCWLMVTTLGLALYVAISRLERRRERLATAHPLAADTCWPDSAT